MFERDVGTRRAPRCRTRLPAAMIPAAFAGPRQSEIFERRIRMRKLIVHAFLTLDGVMHAPGSSNDKSGGFTHGGWTVPFWDGAIEAWQGEATSPPFDLLLGRKTYEIFAGYWPRATDVEDAEVFNSARMYVVSRTLRRVDWEKQHRWAAPPALPDRARQGQAAVRGGHHPARVHTREVGVLAERRRHGDTSARATSPSP
jgi:dihydrofolate reductase